MFAPAARAASSSSWMLAPTPTLKQPHYFMPFKKRSRTELMSLKKDCHISCQTALADTILQDQNTKETSFAKVNSWSVHKFGGTCVGSWERIWKVSGIIVDDPSSQKMVVVSAMSKVTDMLYAVLEKAQYNDNTYHATLEDIYTLHKETATTLLGEGSDLETFLTSLKDDIRKVRTILEAIFIARHASISYSDLIVGHGELWSAQMLAAAVRKRGSNCEWLDARKVLIVNPSGSDQVDPDFETSGKRLNSWINEHPADIIVATGFIASTPENVPTTLKRDGSDFSAAIFGSLLRASQITIWTDVNGVYSADPRKVGEAVILKTMSYQEAWEMSYFGANVLHPRTIIPVMRDDIPITIRNVFNLSAPGTKIWRFPAEEADDAPSVTDSVVKGFATIDNIALINVEGTGMAGVPGTASDMFETVKSVGANVVMISQASSEHSICFAVPEKEAKAVAKALESKFRRALDVGRLSQVDVVPNCSILAAVGQRMASTPGVSATLFSALAKANVNVRAIAQGCSEYNITTVLDRKDTVKALKAVHSRFYLSKTTVSLGIIGPGLIGGTLLGQIKEQAAVLKEELNIDLRVMGIIGSRKMLLDVMSGIDLSNWKSSMMEKGEAADLERFIEYLQSNHSIPNTVVLDCTASSEVAKNYYNWLRKGIHLITPNKKANSGPLEQYLQLRALQRQSYTHYFYEATVGAGLPIISTLRGLLETGDKIHRIEGIFSGTLSYIFNNFSGSKTFSEIVAEAKSAGYTEPDPRDDLSGMDVGRKVIILAREAGMKLELENIPIQNLVPKPLQDLSTVEEFLSRLPEYDHDIARQREEAEQTNEVLRYVGVVDMHANQGYVELKRYPKTHAFAQLSGTDNIIAFTTARYQKQPLIVRGPGAGAEVTAGGVFSDILRLASYLGAPS